MEQSVTITYFTLSNEASYIKTYNWIKPFNGIPKVLYSDNMLWPNANISRVSDITSTTFSVACDRWDNVGINKNIDINVYAYGFMK